MGDSKIEWTEKTWNPTTGCTQVSPGCDHCYAMTLVDTRQVVNPRHPRFGHPFNEVMLHDGRLSQPRSWRAPTTIFVNSMSDLWHVDVPDEYIDRIFDVMESEGRHTFQVLTKRSERMMRYVNHRYPNDPCPAHIWVGVSVESNDYAWRTDQLRGANATIRFISAEPLLGPLDRVSLENINWLIAGGESGRGCREMDIDWVRELRDRCLENGTAFFLKQLGGPTPAKKRGGGRALVDGRRWSQYPTIRRRSDGRRG
jgi:protein gp37